jgi:hypothetical protein
LYTDLAEIDLNPQTMKTTITLKDVWHVIHADLIGKDSHRGITLTYGWFANQVGHFALGFIPSYFVHFKVSSASHAALFVALFWTVFETYNVLSPLYKKEYKGNNSFKVQWGNIVFDMLTDLAFFWTGCTIYYLSLVHNQTVMITFLICFSLLFLAIRYWFLTKLYQQNALFPYQFRLSQWDALIKKEYIFEFVQFLKQKPTSKHYIVLGQKGKGKTRLMVGLANEFAIRHKKCTYTTFSKWATMLEEDDQTLKDTAYSIWNWSTSDFLLIDDINPGTPIEANRFTSKDVLSFILKFHGPRNILALQTTNVAWIVGSCAEGESADDWKKALIELAIPAESIVIIDLDKT